LAKIATISPQTAKSRTKPIRAFGLDGEVTLQARGLTYDEIQGLLLLARQTGWLGNPRLNSFVVDKGLSSNSDQIDLVSRDHFLTCNASREIWILTLQELAAQTNALLRLAGINHQGPRTRRYRYIDLVTPGLLYLVLNEMDSLDVEGFSRSFVRNFFIIAVERGGKLLSRSARRKFADRNFNSLVPFILNVIGLDKDLIRLLPKEVITTPAQKFFVALKLADTLDWAQFQEVVHIYNSALRELVFRSNQLGGIDTTRDQTQLITGVPLLPDLVRPATTMPDDVGARLLHDAVKGNLQHFPPKLRQEIQTSLKEAYAKLAEAPVRHVLSQDKKMQTVLSLWQYFDQAIGRNPKLVAKSCFAYMEDYINYVDKTLESTIQRIQREEQFLSVPDCKVLVEGPSDEVCYRKFVDILNEQGLMIEVEACDGKEDLAKRAIEMRKRESYIGGLVAILDSDATKQAADLQRVLGNDRHAAVLIYKNGVIENQFSLKLHCKVANRLFPEGDNLVASDLNDSRPMDKVLQDALWIKKKAKLNKRLYAEELVKNIRSSRGIPKEARDFTKTVLEIAERRRQELPRMASHISIDRLSRASSNKV
jgi:hypothetical protein